MGSLYVQLLFINIKYIWCKLVAWIRNGVLMLLKHHSLIFDLGYVIDKLYGFLLMVRLN